MHAVLSAVWSLQKAYLLMREGTYGAALTAAKLARKTATYALNVIDSVPSVSHSLWFLKREPVLDLIWKCEINAIICMLEMDDAYTARQHCQEVLKEIPRVSFGEDRALDSTHLSSRFIQLGAISALLLRPSIDRNLEFSADGEDLQAGYFCGESLESKIAEYREWEKATVRYAHYCPPSPYELPR